MCYTPLWRTSLVLFLALPGARASGPASYASTAHMSRASPGETGTSTPLGSELDLERGRERDNAPSAGATKRIRVKRSKDTLKQPGTRTPKTPLLSSALRQTVDFHSDPDSLTTPLPLV